MPSLAMSCKFLTLYKNTGMTDTTRVRTERNDTSSYQCVDCDQLLNICIGISHNQHYMSPTAVKDSCYSMLTSLSNWQMSLPCTHEADANIKTTKKASVPSPHPLCSHHLALSQQPQEAPWSTSVFAATLGNIDDVTYTYIKSHHLELL